MKTHAAGRAERAPAATNKDQEDNIMGININDLPPDVKRKIVKKAGIQREQVLKVAANVVKVCAESGESLAVQRKALELTLRWLKVR
jgi:hypothetical protein